LILFCTQDLLGYQRLWIGSLYIIRDSKEDWLQESAVIGEVYMNSIRTIAALGAKDSNGGCFAKDSLSFKHCTIFSTADERIRVMTPEGKKRDLISAPETEFPRPALHSRSWVVQERALAPRTLFYGSKIILWECRQHKAFEWELRFSINSRHFMPIRPRMKAAWAELISHGEGSTRERCWHECWWYIVSEYTAGRLNFDRDKWTAIGGLASLLQR
jgi:hypothetical protein